MRVSLEQRISVYPEAAVNVRALLITQSYVILRVQGQSGDIVGYLLHPQSSSRILTLQQLLSMDSENRNIWRETWNTTPEERAERRIRELRREIDLLQTSLREMQVVEQDMMLSWAERLSDVNRERQRLHIEIDNANSTPVGAPPSPPDSPMGSIDRELMRVLQELEATYPWVDTSSLRRTLGR